VQPGCGTPIRTTASAGRLVNSPTRSPVRNKTTTVTRTSSRFGVVERFVQRVVLAGQVRGT
jgi:hypothetical protein